MSEAYALSVPLKVDIQAGPNWYDLKTPDSGGQPVAGGNSSRESGRY